MNIRKIFTCMKLAFVALTYPPGIFVDPIPSPWDFFPSLFPPLESWDEDEVVEVLQTDLVRFRVPSCTPLCTSVETIWESLLFKFRLQPFWEEIKGWVPPLESDILVIQGHANWNSQSKLLLKWFVKTMLKLFEKKRLDSKNPVCLKQRQLHSYLQVTRVPKIPRSSFRLSWRIGSFTITSVAGIRYHHNLKHQFVHLRNRNCCNKK